MVKENKKLMILAVAIFLILIFIAYNIFKPTNRQEVANEIDTIKGGEMTLEGTTICLPHKDKTGPQTLECAIGLETANGMFFGLDMSGSNQGFVDTGKNIRVQGHVTPTPALSDSRLEKYDIVGVMRVKTLEEVNTPQDQINESPQDIAHSIGDISFTVPKDFGLAVSQDQLLVSSYIPPCDPNFDYCIYYNGKEYENTNFDSAGVRIDRQQDLRNQETCLTTPPRGLEARRPEIENREEYSTSKFEALGNAGAGHYAQGTLYRLFINENCYEFETRIGESQFANYKPGTIELFTDRNRSDLEVQLQNVIDSIRSTETDKPIIF